MKQSLSLKMGQSLAMTPALQQAIRLLQLSTLDLQTEIQTALDENLMLERVEDGETAEDDGEAAARAVEAAGTDDGPAVAAKMKEMPVDDFFAPGAMLREDGRLMNDLFLVEVKTPAEVTQSWDLLKVVRRVPAEEIIRPLDQGNCPYVQ